MAVHYGKEIVDAVRKTDMIEFFGMYSGFTFKQQGADFRCREHTSLVVKGDRLRWFWNSRGIGGAGVIDYLMKVDGMTFPDAVGVVIGRMGATPSCLPAQSIKKLQLPKHDIFSLPDKGRLPYTRLFTYLSDVRGIDRGIITALLQEGKIFLDNRDNVVFVGFDENNKPRYANVRGTNPNVQFRGECGGSDKRYSFSMEGSSSDALYIFESPIDALSHATLENLRTNNRDAWRRDKRLSLGGTSDVALDRYLNVNEGIKCLMLYLDNDDAGHVATNVLMEKYKEFGFEVLTFFCSLKDCNEDLLEYQKSLISV